jgi:hypothetical protein
MRTSGISIASRQGVGDNGPSNAIGLVVAIISSAHIGLGSKKIPGGLMMWPTTQARNSCNIPNTLCQQMRISSTTWKHKISIFLLALIP